MLKQVQHDDVFLVPTVRSAIGALLDGKRTGEGMGCSLKDAVKTVVLSLSKHAYRLKRHSMTSDWMFHCYLLLCADGSYYCGHTDDMERRLSEHRSGAFGGYTYKRRPVTLVWNDAFQTRDDAKAPEKRIKGWSRAKKEALIAGDWARVSELAKSRQGSR